MDKKRCLKLTSKIIEILSKEELYKEDLDVIQDCLDGLYFLDKYETYADGNHPYNKEKLFQINES